MHKLAAGHTVISPSCKDARRSCTKVVLERNGDWRRLTDIVRATIVYHSVGELVRALRHIAMDFIGIDLLHVRNGFDARQSDSSFPTGGCECCCLQVMLSGDDALHVCELRLAVLPLPLPPVW